MANSDNTGFFLYDPSNTWSYVRNIVSTTDAVDEAAKVLAAASATRVSQVVNFLHSPQTGHFAGHFFFDYYFRIFVVPLSIFVNNPILGVAYPFGIWNAYPGDSTNTLGTITSTGSPGLTIDISNNTVFNSLQYRVVDVRVLPTAPLVINTKYNFPFVSGSGDFNFQAIRSVVLDFQPEVPVEETWNWKSDVLTSYNGTEQRIVLLQCPRRILKFDIALDSDQAYRQHFQALWLSIQSSWLLPMYQYMCSTTQSAALGANTIYLDPTRGDFREGEEVIMVSPNGFQIAGLTTLASDHIIVDTVLGYPMPKDLSFVAPTQSCFIADKTTLQLSRWNSGKISIQGSSQTIRTTLSRPGSSTTFSTLLGLNVLDKLPLANNDVDHTFDGDTQYVDYSPSVPDLISSWKSPKLTMKRDFLINRVFYPEDMDWWRDFIQSTKGQQNAFFIPTWRSDLNVLVQPTVGANQFTVEGNFYSGNFFGRTNIFSQLTLQTDGGIAHMAVSSVSDNGDGSDTIFLTNHLSSGAGWDQINKVSFLVRSRLAADNITLLHSGLSTLLTITTRSTEQ